MRKYYNSNKSSILKQQKQYRNSARGKLVLKARYEAKKMGKGSPSGGKKDNGGDSSRKKLNAANKALARDNVKPTKEASNKVDNVKPTKEAPNKVDDVKPAEKPPNKTFANNVKTLKKAAKTDKKKKAKAGKGKGRGIRLNPNIPTG